mmetsp:Transcript_37845/g.100734  ORF Transcript_37845/g.100734 Transcript_37845/m.100734 type:complete len:214 (-) Transcript_37845:1155-1796(-)
MRILDTSCTQLCCALVLHPLHRLFQVHDPPLGTLEVLLETFHGRLTMLQERFFLLQLAFRDRRQRHTSLLFHIKCLLPLLQLEFVRHEDALHLQAFFVQLLLQRLSLPTMLLRAVFSLLMPLPQVRCLVPQNAMLKLALTSGLITRGAHLSDLILEIPQSSLNLRLVVQGCINVNLGLLLRTDLCRLQLRLEPGFCVAELSPRILLGLLHIFG